ncbi:MAG: prepilin-type N-terminal cleavage/methylation domain-containing protein [Prosthecobacter sp.]
MNFRQKQHHAAKAGFSLLELVIVLLIVALVLSAVYTIASGTITLADDVRKAQQRDGREQAFVSFGDRLFAALPVSAALNLKTSQDGGDYLTELELHGVPSPFNGAPDFIVTLFTETAPGGGLRLMLGLRPAEKEGQPLTEPAQQSKFMLFENLASCEWRAFDPRTLQWTTVWVEPREVNARRIHPVLIEMVTSSTGGAHSRRVFWVAPNTPPQSSPPIAAGNGNAEPVPVVRD